VTVAPVDAKAGPPAEAAGAGPPAEVVVEPLGALQQFGGMRLGLLERVCQLVCAVAIVALAAIVLTEIVTRNLLNFSFQISDEVGGYIVVGLTFLALPVCQARQAYHHVMFIQNRLPQRAREVLNLGFDFLSLAFCAVLIWQLAWQTVQTWQSGDIAPTLLATPLWMPQAVMPIGCIILGLVLVRGIVRRVQRLRRREF
jgi:TRAP-type C4-dicarboxylate transport system permease small subunit